ncbi:unnamed protein product [Clonostachys rosea f. rosea IK726]|uniref:Uncharacterized protein n=1 Tax=Clonostachys rosea f. rosea IK726 TaxID=1349383 RepID=A0ACA9TER1_BIOOC|nr:unnamed protein product [Clonostachys rosea f. rosea IK726]
MTSNSGREGNCFRCGCANENHIFGTCRGKSHKGKKRCTFEWSRCTTGCHQDAFKSKYRYIDCARCPDHPGGAPKHGFENTESDDDGYKVYTADNIGIPWPAQVSAASPALEEEVGNTSIDELQGGYPEWQTSGQGGVTYKRYGDMSGVRESGVGDTTIGCPDTLDWPSERLPTEAGMDSVTQSFAQLGFQEQPGVRRISSSQYDLVQVYPKKGKTRFLDPHTKKEVKTKEEDWEEAQVDDNGTWATCYVYGDRVYAFPLEPENAGEDSAQTGIRRISSSQYDFVQAYRKRGKTRFLDPHTKKEVKTEEEDWEEARVDDNGTLATCYVYEDRVYTFTVMEDTGEPSSSKSKKEKKGKGHLTAIRTIVKANLESNMAPFQPHFNDSVAACIMLQSQAHWERLAKLGRSSHIEVAPADLQALLCRIPALPSEIPKDDTCIVGSSTWTNTSTACFAEPQTITRTLPLRKRNPTICRISASTSFEKWEGHSNNGIALITLGWAYILSVNLAERQKRTVSYTAQEEPPRKTQLLQLKYATSAEKSWWKAILTQRWKIEGDIITPWTLSLENIGVDISSDICTAEIPPSSAQAASYLGRFCAAYDLGNQLSAALAAAMCIPLQGSLLPMKQSEIELPKPAIILPSFNPGGQEFIPEDFQLIDYYMTLSLDTSTMGCTMWSVFWAEGIPCNHVGAWFGPIAALLCPLIEKNDMKSLVQVLSFSKAAPFWAGTEWFLLLGQTQ